MSPSYLAYHGVLVRLAAATSNQYSPGFQLTVLEISEECWRNDHDSKGPTTWLLIGCEPMTVGSYILCALPFWIDNICLLTIIARGLIYQTVAHCQHESMLKSYLIIAKQASQDGAYVPNTMTKKHIVGKMIFFCLDTFFELISRAFTAMIITSPCFINTHEQACSRLRVVAPSHTMPTKDDLRKAIPSECLVKRMTSRNMWLFGNR